MHINELFQIGFEVPKCSVSEYHLTLYCAVTFVGGTWIKKVCIISKQMYFKFSRDTCRSANYSVPQNYHNRPPEVAATIWLSAYNSCKW